MKVIALISLMLLLSLSFAINAITQTQPVLQSAVFPAYPPIAKAVNASGDIKLRATIDTNGDVVKTEIISGHKLLNDSAQFAARQWKFEKLDSITSKQSVELTFRFTLMPRCSDKRN